MRGAWQTLDLYNDFQAICMKMKSWCTEKSGIVVALRLQAARMIGDIPPLLMDAVIASTVQQAPPPPVHLRVQPQYGKVEVPF